MELGALVDHRSYSESQIGIIIINDVAALLLKNLHGVFEEEDDARRAIVADEIYADDVEFIEPHGIYRGKLEIMRVAAKIRAMHPTFAYAPTHPPEVVHEQAGCVRWVSGVPGEPAAYAGTDFIIVEGGKIKKVILFFDGKPDPTNES